MTNQGTKRETSVTGTYIQAPVEEFDDAEFYEGGAIAVFDKGEHQIVVVREGDSYLSQDDDEEALRTAAQFREHFPDGKIPVDGTDGWHWENNGWFMIYLDGDPTADDVYYSLKDALADAESLPGGMS
jgi:hypothetical protein